MRLKPSPISPFLSLCASFKCRHNKGFCGNNLWEVVDHEKDQAMEHLKGIVSKEDQTKYVEGVKEVEDREEWIKGATRVAASSNNIQQRDDDAEAGENEGRITTNGEPFVREDSKVA